MSDLDLLRGLGDQIVPPPLDSLRETANRRARRTTATVAVATAVVTVGVIAASLSFFADDDSAAPEPIAPTPADTARPLTYAAGADLHLGEATVTMSVPVAEIDLTDNGAIVRTEDGTIWFTGGEEPQQVGTLGSPGDRYATSEPPLFTPNGWVVSGNLGTLAAWFEFPVADAPVLVVLDTETLEPVVDRVPITVRGETWEMPQSVTEDAVFWFVDALSEDDAMPAARFVIATGTQEAISGEEYAASLPAEASPRLLVTNGPGLVPYSPTDGIPQQFGVSGGFFKPVAGGDFRASDGLTGEPMEFKALDGYQRSLVFLTQWIDDDTVVLRADSSTGYDLLVCKISTKSCQVEASLPTSIVLPDLG